MDGSFQVLIDTEVKILDEGDLLLVPPHTPHAFAAAPGTRHRSRRTDRLHTRHAALRLPPTARPRDAGRGEPAGSQGIVRALRQPLRGQPGLARRP
ncbi:hypothetical protein ACFW1M_37530 [Streptomyces inhibens]|uniref:hypothetical protein n=1 Tax=Streptomyces inhibens TaxID=2293571 RepID=UPI0036870BA9